MQTTKSYLLHSKLKEIDIIKLGAHWTVNQDICYKNSFILRSDIGDELVVIWGTKKGEWYSPGTGPHYDVESAKEAAIETFISKLEIKLKKVNFFYNTTAKTYFMLYQNSRPYLLSIEKTLLERATITALESQLSKYFPDMKPCDAPSNLSIMNYSGYSVRLLSFYIPHAFSRGKCILQPGPIALNLELTHLENNQKSIKKLYLKNLYDQTFLELPHQIIKTNKTSNLHVISAANDTLPKNVTQVLR